MKKANLKQKYEKRHESILAPIAEKLVGVLKGYLNERPKMPRIDVVTARAKDPKSFMAKSKRLADDLKTPYYDDPLGEIQDQIGARIVVFYNADVESVVSRILRYTTHIEDLKKEPDHPWKFGYIGRHLMLKMPKEAVPRNIALADAPPFFELQIKSLFQHAWSETCHDPAYKPPRPLTAEEARLFSFSAASAWGADRVIQELVHEIMPETRPRMDH
jgi:putative GTP pyrophosphokinase